MEKSLTDEELTILLLNSSGMVTASTVPEDIRNYVGKFIDPDVRAVVADLRAARARLAEVEPSDVERVALLWAHAVLDADDSPENAGRNGLAIAYLDRLLKTKGTR